jgi:pimeloyl-ACP methyl ester carboxylesterase
MPDRKIFLFLLISFFTVILHGCEKQATNPEENQPFVGGPENPALDGSYTAKIYSENGIASLEEVTLSGEKQWILIRGYDISNPLLIFLHGGPGSPCIPYARFSMGGLEHNFVVITWDQRGCGKSYHDNIDPNTITREQLYSDAKELIQMMMNRFEVDKVYLIGISWGAILGINIARDQPEQFYAYIGIGQPVDTHRGIETGLQAALDKAIEQDNQTAVAELSVIPSDSTIWEHWDTINKWLEKFGYGDLHDTTLYEKVREDMRAATEYTTENFANVEKWENLYNSSPLIQDIKWLKNLNLSNQIPELQVPVYFFAGRYDYKAPSVLVDEYFQVLEAPAKWMIWFENSAHVPIVDEREEFHKAMINIVLAETNPAVSM